MPTLYELSQDLLALEALLTETGGEITDDDAGAALERWFDELGEQRDAKIDGYCQLILEITARHNARKAEIARLGELIAGDAKAIDRLKARLKGFFEAQGIKKLETARFRLSVQGNGGALPLIVPEAWEKEPASAPEAFQRRVIQLDKEAIREAIRNDDETHGASLGERANHLRIR